MGDKTLIGCRVSPERKERWDEFLEQSDEYGSMAQLIRTSVEKEINSEDGFEGDIEKLRDDITTVLGEIEEVKKEIDGFEDVVDDAEQIADETVFRLEQYSKDSDTDLDVTGGDDDGV